MKRYEKRNGEVEKSRTRILEKLLCFIQKSLKESTTYTFLSSTWLSSTLIEPLSLTLPRNSITFG